MTFEITNPLCVALDSPDPATNRAMAAEVAPHAGVLKVGLTAFVAAGADLVRDVAALRPVFLDLKLHDIPVQVAGAVAAAAATGASLLTVHASGGPEMVRRAVDAAGNRVTILAVTVLTSLDDDDLERVGLAGPPEKAVLRLAELALDAGAPGLVCSPHETAHLRERFGPRSEGGPLLVVPGIRPRAAGDDQKRTLTPHDALAAGADLIVVGRPVTEAASPGAAAHSLLP